jgi:hypothetical protein
MNEALKTQKRFVPLKLLIIATLGIVLSIALFATQKPRELQEIPLPKIMRVSSGGASQHLEVPILHYQRAHGDSLIVDFLGAVHIGELHYYRKLNELLRSYDSVLFELIAERNGDALRQRGVGQHDSSLGSFQRKMAEFCGLHFQLDHIDYGASNFVHADLSPQQLLEAMEKRGESPLKLILKLLKLSFDPQFSKSLEDAGFRSSGLEGVNPLLIIMRGPTDTEKIKIKRFMAQGLVASEAVLGSLEGESGISLIDDRNAAIVNVLRSHIAAGKQRIGIFYGAGHAPDLHDRLRKELGLKLVKVEWLPAWDLG